MSEAGENPVSPEEQKFYELLAENLKGIAESAEMMSGFSGSIRDLVEVSGEGLDELSEAALFRAIKDSLGVDLLQVKEDDESVNKIRFEGDQPSIVLRIQTKYPQVVVDKVIYEIPPEEVGESEIDYQITILE